MQLQAIAWHHAFYVINLCHSIWWVRNSITNLSLGEFHDQSLIFECEWVLTSQCIPIFIVNGNYLSFFRAHSNLTNQWVRCFEKKELLLESTTLDYGRKQRGATNNRPSQNLMTSSHRFVKAKNRANNHDERKSFDFGRRHFYVKV